MAARSEFCFRILRRSDAGGEMFAQKSWLDKIKNGWYLNGLQL